MDHLLTCAECGSTLYVQSADQVYCSVPCARSAQRKERAGGEYREWKRQVIERDGGCQMCGAKDTRLLAHHIVGISECPEAKMDISNGMTLCVLCHDIIHDTVGYTLGGWAGVKKGDYAEL